MPRLRIGVYGPDPATGSRLNGVLRGRTETHVEFRPFPDEGVPPARVRPGQARAWLDALVDGEVDLALCPIEAVRETLDDRIEIVGVPERGDPRDVLLGRRGEPRPLAALVRGAPVAAHGFRAQGLLRTRRPDLEIVPATDLASDLLRVDSGELEGVIGSYHWIVGTSDIRRIGEVLPLTEWIPDPGQAALAILARRGESATIEVGEHLIHPETMRAVRAEIATAQLMGHRNDSGLGVIGLPFPGGLRLWGMVVSVDGTQVVRAEVSATGDRPEGPARRLGRALRRRGADLVGRTEASLAASNVAGA